ncbi:MAG: nicotinate (nicotinamide) nucleotide adenylyltransferase [Bacteroidota bacterium]
MKIGLFFGSFNPIHVGHMVLANYMLEFTDLEGIWFVVSPHNPLKKKNSLLDEKQRLHMVNLAIGDNPKLRSSNIEFSLPQPSYTIITLTYLKEKYPQHEFALIMGADNLESFHKWKNYEEILKHYQLYVYPRPDNKGSSLESHPQVKLVNAPLMELSSTSIRKAILEKKDVRYYMPEAVGRYIQEMHFYEK